MKPPNATKAKSHGVQAIAATMPTATAAVIDVTASAQRTVLGICVASGLPWSSSSAWAPMPSARKNAISVAPRRPGSHTGASAAPMTT